MRTASGLMLVALGAILAFAVKGHPAFLNIQIVGWVIMLTGVAGMLIPRRGYGWLRRRMVLRRGPQGRPVVNRVEETRYPPYVMLNPGTGGNGTTVVADAATATDRPDAGGPPTVVGPAAESGVRVIHPDAERRAAERAATDWAAAEQAVAEWENAEMAAAPGEPRPAEEVVEEYVEE
jgi:hypothetical protein